MDTKNIIPMGGLSNRFKLSGYLTPKHLIKIDEFPMFYKVALSMPKCDRWIFIIREDNFIKQTKSYIAKFFNNYDIVVIDEETRGQAETCLMAQKYLTNIDLINISSCDSGFVFDENSYASLLKNSDVLVWGYKGHSRAICDPNSYGWINHNEEIVKEVSCKKQISEDPANDSIVIGTFTFKKAVNFIENTSELIQKKVKINNEFYMDSVPNICIKNLLKVSHLLVDEFFCWGTPDELKDYKKENKFS